MWYYNLLTSLVFPDLPVSLIYHVAFVSCLPIWDTQWVEQRWWSVAIKVNYWCVSGEPRPKCSRQVLPNLESHFLANLLQYHEDNQDFKIQEMKGLLLQDKVSVLAWVSLADWRQDWSSNGERISYLQGWAHAREVLSSETKLFREWWSPGWDISH